MLFVELLIVYSESFFNCFPAIVQMIKASTEPINAVISWVTEKVVLAVFITMGSFSSGTFMFEEKMGRRHFTMTAPMNAALQTEPTTRPETSFALNSNLL